MESCLFLLNASSGENSSAIFFYMGAVLFAGFVGILLSSRFKTPRIFIYVIMGILLGRSGLNLIGDAVIDGLQPVVLFVLSIVGLSIGLEMNLAGLKELKGPIISVTVFQALGTFFTVAAVSYLFTRDWALSLLLGAISSATDPSSTLGVLWQTGSRGPVTTGLFAAVSLDDAIALVIYAFALAHAKMTLQINESFSLLRELPGPLLELAGSIIVGLILGILVNEILKRTGKKEEALITILGALFLCTGICNTFGISVILSGMVMGAAIVNLSEDNRRTLDVLTAVSNPFMIFLFVLMGAGLDMKDFPAVALLCILYIIARSAGKIGSSRLGAIVSGASEPLRKYLGLGLLSQAGIAISLAMEISCYFSKLGAQGEKTASVIATVAAVSVVIFEIIGPFLTRQALLKAGEIPEGK